MYVGVGGQRAGATHSAFAAGKVFLILSVFFCVEPAGCRGRMGQVDILDIITIRDDRWFL